ncbi:MAG: sialate O-acetylesterase [Oscillospiraceae bacterium]|jgi:sialate O-acetylesterase|nr:sialate O-acetylesterase [Oscillospiraceae bacterium]
MTLSPLFTDGCVLRMGTGSAIFGRAQHGERVTAEFQGVTYETFGDASGRFNIALSELSHGGAFELRVNDVVLRDVYVGEVWLCAGQSNMQITFARIGRRYPEVMAAPPEPRIRRFLVPQDTDFTAPRADIVGSWAQSDPEHIADFTAVGWFFAKKRMERTGVPVGLLATAIGGTPIHCWLRNPPEYPAALYTDDQSAPPAPNFGATPCNPEVTQSGSGVTLWRKRVTIPPEFAGQRAELALGTIVDADTTYVNGVEVGSTAYRYPPRYYTTPPLPEGACEIVVKQTIIGGWGKFTEGKTRELRISDGVIPLVGDWERRRVADFPSPVPFTAPQNDPCGYYNAMIAPLHGFAISGALWYQGESDDKTPRGYFERFSQMLREWRGAWGWDFPMLTVGLARFDETDWTRVREEQLRCAELPNVGFYDAWGDGEPNDLHPLNKRSIGEGLAGLIL